MAPNRLLGSRPQHTPAQAAGTDGDTAANANGLFDAGVTAGSLAIAAAENSTANTTASGADLSGTDLSGTDLSGTDLSGTLYFGHNSTRSNLPRTNQSAILKEDEKQPLSVPEQKDLDPEFLKRVGDKLKARLNYFEEMTIAAEALKLPVAVLLGPKSYAEVTDPDLLRYFQCLSEPRTVSIGFSLAAKNPIELYEDFLRACERNAASKPKLKNSTRQAEQRAPSEEELTPSQEELTPSQEELTPSQEELTPSQKEYERYLDEMVLEAELEWNATIFPDTFIKLLLTLQSYFLQICSFLLF
jgi:hypothetical protein